MIGGDEVGSMPNLDDVDWGDGELDGDGGGSDEEGDGETKKRVLILGGAGAFVFLIICGAAWFILGSSSDDKAAASSGSSGPTTRIEMALPQAGTTVNSRGVVAAGAAGGPTPAAAPRGGGLNALGTDGEGTPLDANPADASQPPAKPPAKSEEQSAEAAPAAPAAPAEAAPAAAPAPAPAAPAVSAEMMPEQKGGGSLNAFAAPGTTPAAAQQGAGLVVASVSNAAYSAVPEVAPQPLAQKPDQAMQEQGSEGFLPKVDGNRQAWQVYARPFDKGDKRPRIAIIVGNLGLSPPATNAAIKRLPAAVTLAFDAYGTGLENWAGQARDAGHEIMVSVSTEAETFPALDPGPQALLTTLEPSDNLRRLNFALSRFPGYVGIVTNAGSRFNAVEGQLRPVMEVLKRRGLMFVDGGSAKQTAAPKLADEVGVPDAWANFVIDENPAKASIDETLTKLELAARQGSGAVGLASAYPSTVERLAAWIGGLEAKNIALAPASALADKQPKPSATRPAQQ
jgi:polysaccharide deacetylase 2 family uncharacterized protein YibQ